MADIGFSRISGRKTAGLILRRAETSRRQHLAQAHVVGQPGKPCVFPGDLPGQSIGCSEILPQNEQIDNIHWRKRRRQRDRRQRAREGKQDCRYGYEA